MKESSYASLLALSLKKTKDFYVLFQSGSDTKEWAIQARKRTKNRLRQIPIIYSRLALVHEVGISKQRPFLRDGK